MMWQTPVSRQESIFKLAKTACWNPACWASHCWLSHSGLNARQKVSAADTTFRTTNWKTLRYRKSRLARLSLWSRPPTRLAERDFEFPPLAERHERVVTETHQQPGISWATEKQWLSPGPAGCRLQEHQCTGETEKGHQFRFRSWSHSAKSRALLFSGRSLQTPSTLISSHVHYHMLLNELYLSFSVLFLYSGLIGNGTQRFMPCLSTIKYTEG